MWRILAPPLFRYSPDPLLRVCVKKVVKQLRLDNSVILFANFAVSASKTY